MHDTKYLTNLKINNYSKILLLPNTRAVLRFAVPWAQHISGFYIT